jgi:DNA-binding LytR/AlgR family response regulator
MIKCIVVDDEPIARKGISDYVLKIPFLKLEGSFSDGLSAMEFLNKYPIDVLVLDINMPEFTGLQLLKSLIKKPVSIIVSAYPEFAVESFDLDVIDYLVKPVPFERFLKAMNKAKQYLELLQNNSASGEYFFIKSDNKIEKVSVDDVLFIESLHNYVKIYTTVKKYMSLLTLKALEEYLPGNKFIKVHKSYVVNTDKINSIEGDELNINSHKIPMSRNLKDEVIHKLMGKKFLKR